MKVFAVLFAIFAILVVAGRAEESSTLSLPLCPEKPLAACRPPLKCLYRCQPRPTTTAAPDNILECDE